MQHAYALLILLVAAALVTGCGVDADLLRSGKIHVENIQATAAKLETDPGNADMKKKLSEYVQYYKTVIKSAGEGNASSLEEAIFDGMDADKAKKLLELIRTTR